MLQPGVHDWGVHMYAGKAARAPLLSDWLHTHFQGLKECTGIAATHSWLILPALKLLHVPSTRTPLALCALCR